MKNMSKTMQEIYGDEMMEHEITRCKEYIAKGWNLAEEEAELKLLEANCDYQTYYDWYWAVHTECDEGDKSISDVMGEDYVKMRLGHLKDRQSILDNLQDACSDDNDFQGMAFASQVISYDEQEITLLEKNAPMNEYNRFQRSVLKEEMSRHLTE